MQINKIQYNATADFSSWFSESLFKEAPISNSNRELSLQAVLRRTGSFTSRRARTSISSGCRRHHALTLWTSALSV